MNGSQYVVYMGLFLWTIVLFTVNSADHWYYMCNSLYTVHVQRTFLFAFRNLHEQCNLLVFSCKRMEHRGCRREIV